jgi:hypothetical protein
MTFAWTRSRALFALAGFAAALAAPAQAADDKSTISAVGELFGYSTDPSAASIDYRERPKLVLPPRAGALPAPKEGATRPENWPTDAAAIHRRNSDRYARIPGAPPPEEEKKVGVFDRIMGKGGETPDHGVSLQEPARRMLTEPPAAYRKPTMDLSKLPDKEKDKKGSWWNPATYFGGTGAEATAPAIDQTGQKPAAQQASGGSSSWLPQMPRFVSGEGRESKD